MKKNNFMKIILGLFFVIVVIVEIALILNAFLTVKYQIEEAENMTQVLNKIYSILNNGVYIIIFDLIYLLVLHILYFKK
ncbi:MAG: hypothetical protein M3Z80_09650 [Apibacter sp.]|uniref:hypothetical protein n=2 Tax=Apibacter TaxID=1778601 RepID=UPI0025F79FF8|nr:hypothetical protein [Apibacter sp.]MCT6870195.1 hypothetical protein [Apibacter sp.]